MMIRKMDIFKYDSNGWDWKKESVEKPRWEDIEAAIRQLDRHGFPFIWLYAKIDVPEDEPPFVSVMGGQGVFLIEGYPDSKHFVYWDDSKNDQEVAVWTSDQGYSVSGKNLCEEIDETLKAVKYICETGNLPQDVCWKQD